MCCSKSEHVARRVGLKLILPVRYKRVSCMQSPAILLIFTLYGTCAAGVKSSVICLIKWAKKRATVFSIKKNFFLLPVLSRIIYYVTSMPNLSGPLLFKYNSSTLVRAH